MRVGLAYTLGMTGRSDEVLRIVREAEERGGAAWVGFAYVAIGDYDRAFQWLDEVVSGDILWDAVLYLKVHPFWDPIRSDPRFDELVRRLKLPE